MSLYGCFFSGEANHFHTMIKSWAELEIAWSELVPTLLKEDDFNKYTTQLQPECMSSVTHQIAGPLTL